MYLSLCSGAIAVGLLVGSAPALLHKAPAARADPRTATAVQTILDEKPSIEDRQWAARTANENGASIAPEHRPTATPVAAFGFCHTGGGTNCVVDGDTIWVQGQKIRLADIDAPETHDYRCSAEKALGDQATQRLIQLVNSGAVRMQPIDRDEDVYGRKLRILFVEGRSVGDTLVSEGLARPFNGGRKPWC